MKSAVLATLLGSATAYNNGAPHSRLPALGWSSWVALGPGAEHPIFDFCDETNVMNAMDAFFEVGLYDAGYRHFHLDDCWAGKERNATGHVVPEADHFPGGMKAVVDYAHSKGLTFGLYTCAGTKTCVGGRPGSKDHWQQDADVYAEWGVDWVKMDWCNTNGMVPEDTYPLMSAALNKTGRPMHLNMCEWGKDEPWNWGGKIAQSWRMSGDHTPVWASTKQQIELSAKIPANGTGREWGWNDMDMLETGNYEQAAHANGKEGTMTATEYQTEFTMWAISASPLTVTTPIMNCTGPPPPPPPPFSGKCSVALTKQLSNTKCVPGTSFGCYDDEAVMWTSGGCRGEFACDGMAAATFCNVEGGRHANCTCGVPPPAPGPAVCKGWISDLQKKILLNTEAIAVNQDVTPQGRPLVDGNLTVWARHLTGGDVAVALYNEGDTASPGLHVEFAALGWPAGQKATVRDLWAHADVGTATDRTTSVPVAPHEAILYRLSPITE